MGSVYRDRYDDSRTSISSAPRRDGGGYTTVKRYVVKEEDRDSRSSVGRARSFVPERGGERVEETRIITRERETEEPVREYRREEPRTQERELVIRRERDESPRARSVVYDSRREESRREEPRREEAAQELVIRRTTERDEPRHDDFEVSRYEDRKVVDTRYRDDYQMLPRGYDRDDVQKYSRTTDYFAPAPPPQTIIIRQEPIIIRERIRDDDYQMVRKSDVDEERSVVRNRDRHSSRGEEDFFYEKKVRERIDDRRDDRRNDDDYYERRSRRRSVSPHDSVSQVGRRDRDRDYSSDDSMVYVRKETTTRDESPSPDRKRGLAAGVLAGVGAAELLRNHKRKEGQEVSGGVGRVGRDLGAGALGALAAEGIHRARSMHRSRSRRRRSRSRSDSRGGGRRRSRSRSESPNKLKALGTVGLGAAALAAAATFAVKRMNKGKDEEKDGGGRGRSRSRSRAGRRAESLESLENDPDAPSDDPRNPKHRRNTIAKVGAGGAVVAALIEHARNKSKGRDGGRERSRSRIRQALPIIAAGLGSAAVAGVYEKSKAKKEAEVMVDNKRRARSRSRSRARSEQTAYYDGPGQPPVNEQGLVEYGNTPMYGNNFGPDYYGRPPPQEGYYSNAVVAAPVAAAGYGAQRETRSRSRSLSRDRGGRRDRSSSSSQDRGGRRSSRDAAKLSAAAAAGAAGASEAERRKQDRRDRRARRRQQEEGYGRDPYEDNYNPGGQYAPTPPPPGSDPYATQQGFYPQSSQFPPPPGSMPQQYPAQPMAAAAPGAAYAQQGYPPPPPPPSAPPGPIPHFDTYASGANPYAPRGPENVSAEPNVVFGNPFAPARAPTNDQNHIPDGLNRSATAPVSSFANNESPFYEQSFPPPPSYPTPQPTSTYEPPVSGPPPLSTPLRHETYPDTISREISPPLTPRGASPPRSQSQPPSANRKSVQFAAKPEFSDAVAPLESETSTSDQWPARKHQHSHSRGYDAGEDTDSTPDEQRRGIRDFTSRSLHPDSAEPERRRHRRRRSHDPSSRGEPSSSSKAPEIERVASPDSDATVDLPARFDEKGRKRTEAGDDPMADRLDEILAGRGTAGKVFGNFFDGLFGPDGRKKKGK